MARPKGVPKSGGRQKGTPNKDKKTLEEKCLELGFDPFEILAHFAKGDWKALGYESPTRVIGYSKDHGSIEADVITPELRQSSAKEAAKYVHPQKKAVEHSTGQEGFKIIVESYIEKK